MKFDVALLAALTSLMGTVLPAMSNAQTPATPPELIVHNAKVTTQDASRPSAQALAVREGKITAVGSNAEVLKMKGPSTRVIDAKGRRTLPRRCIASDAPR